MFSLENNKVCRVWCEFDLGQNDVVFINAEIAEQFMEAMWNKETGFETAKEAEADGLLTYETIEVVVTMGQGDD